MKKASICFFIFILSFTACTQGENINKELVQTENNSKIVIEHIEEQIEIQPLEVENVADEQNEVNAVEEEDVLEEQNEVQSQEVEYEIEKQNEIQSEESDDMNGENSDIEKINEVLSEEGLPLIGENVFDPKSIKVGDELVGFKLIDINYDEATVEYPFDTVVAQFSGETVLVGTIYYTEECSEGGPGRIVFIVDEECFTKLPVSHHDIRVSKNKRTSIRMINQEDIQEALTIITEDITDKVKIKINDYRHVYKANEAINSATFIEIVND